MRALLLLVLLLLVVPAALAQEEQEGHSHDPFLDPAVSPVVVPTTLDFVDLDKAGDAAAAANVGVSGYVEVTSDQKLGLLTPFYRFNPNLSLKARVPLIFDRTAHFYAADASASGLGDVALDAQYERLAGPGAVWRLMASVKLPTGDDENTVEVDGFEYGVPLGTGTTDLMARGQYAKSAPDFGWVASVLFRKNGGFESYTYDYGTYQETTTQTNGNQLIGSVFARKRVSPSFWVHLGLSATKLANGNSKTEYTNDTPTYEYDIETAGTLLDVFPGISYALGSLQPFVGARIPLSTSFDNEFASTDRDAAFIFQFSYNPDRMGN
ncbi:MAG TPA: hypothetical protein P5571_09810 [Candidatus Krumholzibacteria bacterium]|nr:hypothetical protein [Candidatus Krumholzibacteria bacterium]HRX51648.1 hypothetical protein [Candidatus Krumholzibacteria bacterium]